MHRISGQFALYIKTVVLPGAVLKILKDVFGERSTLSELLSDFYQCRQKEKQSLQDYSHELMNKLDKIHNM